MRLIEFTAKGLYCPIGDFYIDPWQPVEKAIITHAHSDHARVGSRTYLSHPLTKPLLEHRLGDVSVSTMEWGETIYLNGVKLSLHPAGHIIGSSQVRLEYKGQVWVFSGDYKTENDGISGAFEPVRCHHFITESTFGLPVYQWKKQAALYDEIRTWIRAVHQQGRIPVITGYSLGKAQRIIEAIGDASEIIYAHGAVFNIQETLLRSGVNVRPVIRVTAETERNAFRNAVVVAPPGAEDTPWLKKFGAYSIASCSGWMQVRGNVRRKNVDAGFVISDHADWQGLLSAVETTGATTVYATHGFQSAFSRYLNEKGIQAHEVKTAYAGEEEEEEKPSTTPGQEEEMNTANKK